VPDGIRPHLRWACSLTPLQLPRFGSPACIQRIERTSRRSNIRRRKCASDRSDSVDVSQTVFLKWSSSLRAEPLTVLLQSSSVIGDGSVRTLLKRSLRSGTQAASTAFQSSGAVVPDMRSRPKANWPLRIRCSNSTTEIVIAACPKSFNPSRITAG
jgi:hypothetical protein